MGGVPSGVRCTLAQLILGIVKHPAHQIRVFQPMGGEDCKYNNLGVGTPDKLLIYG